MRASAAREKPLAPSLPSSRLRCRSVGEPLAADVLPDDQQQQTIGKSALRAAWRCCWPHKQVPALGCSPKRRRLPRRPRQLRVIAAAEATDDNFLRAPSRPRSCSRNNSTRNASSSKSHSRRASAAAAAAVAAGAAATRRPFGTCCSSECETETLQSTSASGRDEPSGRRAASPRVSIKRRKTAAAATQEAAAARAAAAAQDAAAEQRDEACRRLLQAAADLGETAPSQQQQHQQQQEQQQHGVRFSALPRFAPRRRSAAMVCQAAAAKTAAAAAGAAAAPQNVRSSAAPGAAAVLNFLSSSLDDQPGPSGEAAAAEASANSPCCSADRTHGSPSAGGGATATSVLPPARAAAAAAATATVATAATASEASRAAYWREELLHRAENRYTAVFIPVDKKLAEQVDCDFLASDISRYPVKSTPCGIVFYSPRYADDRYIYRHVLLSSGVRRAAEQLSRASKSAFLTEGQFIYQLGIHLSPGWEHFMRFGGQLRELILRRPQQPEDSAATTLSDELSEESDDSELEEGGAAAAKTAAATAAAAGPRSPPLRHEDLGQLLQQIAQAAMLQQLRHRQLQQQQEHQQQLAVSTAVEKAQRLLLQLVHMQRAGQHQQQWQQQQQQQRLQQQQPAELLRRDLRSLCNNLLLPWAAAARSRSALGGDALKLRQQLLLRCIAAVRQHTLEAGDRLVLHHRLLRLIRRGLRSLQQQPAAEQQEAALPGCPQKQQEPQQEQQQQQQQRNFHAKESPDYSVPSSKARGRDAAPRKRKTPGADAAPSGAASQSEGEKMRQRGITQTMGLSSVGGTAKEILQNPLYAFCQTEGNRVDYLLLPMRLVSRSTDKKPVRRFLRIGSYYRRFIKGFGRTAQPLKKLIPEGAAFTWGDEQERASQMLKAALEK